MASRTRIDLEAPVAPREIGGQSLDDAIGTAAFGLAQSRPDVGFARAVTGLAVDSERGPRRGVGVSREVVVFPETRRVAFRAHQVPGVIPPGPVQGIVERDLLTWMEREPTPPAGVPGHAQTLQAAAREREQVLLERLDADGVLGLEIGG